MRNGVYIPMKLSRRKVERLRKLYDSTSPEQAIEQMLDDRLYMEEMRRLMRRYRGKGNIKNVYE
ncbi:hypothetical protein L0337_28955 [candidate division KSB1 bacterium]|nr:hypothetical protein [candidate division KSB1 bacterium]